MISGGTVLCMLLIPGTPVHPDSGYRRRLLAWA
jgi:hypothetical protein